MFMTYVKQLRVEQLRVEQLFVCSQRMKLLE
jgi:hypothetical protein